jgi:cell pole-organizing protein PopZ
MASNPQHEPTMEEILASIRKIISEDSNEAPAAAAPAAPTIAAPKAVEAEEPDVLELTQEVEEEPAPAPVQMAAPAPVAQAPEPVKPSEDIEFKTVEEPRPAPAAAAVTTDGIFSDKSRKALDDAFAGLDAPAADEPELARPSAVNFASRPAPDGDSVEAVFERAVRDAVGPHIDQWMSGQKDALIAAMKPLIREWMDDHFPALLEGAVRDEVARAVKARGRR